MKRTKNDKCTYLTLIKVCVILCRMVLVRSMQFNYKYFVVSI